MGDLEKEARELLAAEYERAGFSDSADRIRQGGSFPAIRALVSVLSDLREAEKVRNLAYGLLWHMQIDTRDDNLKLASDARKTLLQTMSKDDQADGITRAKMTDARFTGAA